MTGHITYNPPAVPHVCEPGVVRRWNGRKFEPPVNVGAQWACNDCGSIWRYSGTGWVETALTSLP